MSQIETIMRMAPVIPVLVIDDIHQARPIAEALVAGGLKVLEVTLRTPDALEAITRMNLVPGAVVGAGTVTNKDQLDAALAAGAEFIVSPGLTEALGQAVKRSGVPYLPGIATPSELMTGLDLGFTHFKFFPAEANGGIPALKALTAVFGQCRFCPTGGISAKTAPDWLAIERVLCVGGSWVVPKGATPAEIEALAREAASLAG
ncbi:keto-hydroxyglutarate-aldolase/keto-deoxy-phosphogluconate aldolase [Aurantiacibacter xanthus]|uniref:2-dehydro-3-deoxy-phosphogluconate aldolase n=1 Tax=Aurantiacibacter xanthus TaxID=1784712 RepID=A0A3A1NYL5_9SPHN|nr:bifunctional 4-hydroxy-2-oxoglutarate aldolase/2-dehydro-3-deoxy-phosphogluconate aldolase [Aurantiacibacter xanthus]RIV80459.1 keto-hydroxyglutarate-aldolase/keto-deoxy-phosphogluconate aldolase [Aurantiacibacter xanthus]